MNIRKILIATDLSEAASQGFPRVAGLARQLGAEVTLLNVDEVSRFGFPDSSTMDAYLEEVSRQRERLLEEARQALARHDLEVYTQILVGDPVDQIVDFARKMDADLLVLAKRGLRSIRRMILGHTARRVLRAIHIPTLVLPTRPDDDEDPIPPTRYKRILAAAAFNAFSERGLQAVLRLAEKLDARVDYVHVLRLPVPLPAVPGEPPLLVPRTERRLVAENLTRSLARVVSESGSDRCTAGVTIGVSVAESLLEAAEAAGADLVAIPSRGRGRMASTLLGSTADSVVKHARIPVLVLPGQWLIAS